MQELSGFTIFGQVTNTIGFNANTGFTRPSSGGGGSIPNYLVTELTFNNITTELDEPIILEQ
jgi:hypothetical protein